MRGKILNQPRWAYNCLFWKPTTHCVMELLQSRIETISIRRAVSGVIWWLQEGISFTVRIWESHLSSHHRRGTLSPNKSRSCKDFPAHRLRRIVSLPVAAAFNLQRTTEESCESFGAIAFLYDTISFCYNAALEYRVVNALIWGARIHKTKIWESCSTVARILFISFY